MLCSFTLKTEIFSSKSVEANPSFLSSTFNGGFNESFDLSPVLERTRSLCEPLP